MEAKKIIANIKQMYSDYSIPTNLQRHMLAVAGVAKQLSDNCKVNTNSNALVAASLIHDLGNIVKMQFDEKHAKSLLDDKDFGKIAFYREKQKEFIEKYGEDDEEANIKIASEIGAPKDVAALLECHATVAQKGLSTINENFEAQLLFYSDLRVSPNGVVPLKERLNEYAKRHSFDKDPIKTAQSKEFVKAAIEMEEEIFKKMKIKPEEITPISTKKCLTGLFP